MSTIRLENNFEVGFTRHALDDIKHALGEGENEHQIIKSYAAAIRALVGERNSKDLSAPFSTTNCEQFQFEGRTIFVIEGPKFGKVLTFIISKGRAIILRLLDRETDIEARIS